MASTAALVITSVSSGGFALAGGFLNNWMTGRRDERALAAQTALTLPDSETLIWTLGGGWTDLNVALQRQETRLAFAGVPDDLVTAFHRVTLACWRDFQDIKGFEDDGSESHSISTDLLDARRTLGSAVAAYLIGRKRRMPESARWEAIAAANAVMTEWEAEHPNFRAR